MGPREPAGSRPAIELQRAALARACEERGERLVAVEQDVRSGRTLRRPGLRRAIARCRAGEADGVLVMRLDRLTYSLGDLADLVHGAVRDGYALVALDPPVDLESEQGRLVAAVLAEAATWTPRSLVRRAEVLVRRDRDRIDPVRGRGRPSSTPPAVAERVRRMRADGLTLQAICDTLNAEGIPTPRGGALWRPTSLRAILREPVGSRR